MSDITSFPPIAEGERVRLDALTEADGRRLARLDWLRSLRPELTGWTVRPTSRGIWGASLARPLPDGPAVGVLDAAQLPGYDGVANVSIFADVKHSRGGLVLEAYGLLVNTLFEQGVRRIHHEVLEFNGPIHRAMRMIAIDPTARLREHGYAAGRFWDVLVYSYDRRHWEEVLPRMFPRNPFRPGDQRAEQQPPR